MLSTRTVIAAGVSIVFCVSCGEKEEEDASGDTDTDSDADSDADSDECYIGDYMITNNEDMDFFYPYTCIIGNLSVSSPEIVSLSLPNLEIIEGNLIIGDGSQTGVNSALTTISMESLGAVSGNFDIVDNPILSSVEMSSLSTVGGWFEIGYRDDEDFYTGGNPYLENLNGFDELSAVDMLLISGNRSLVSLSGINNLSTVSNTLWIWFNEALPDCETCSIIIQLSSIPENVLVHENLSDACTPAPENCP